MTMWESTMGVKSTRYKRPAQGTVTMTAYVVEDDKYFKR